MGYFFIGLFVFIVLLVAVMAFFSYLATKYWQRKSIQKHRKINETSPYRRPNKYQQRPNNEVLSKDRGLEKLKQEKRLAEVETGVTLYNEEKRQELLAEQSRDAIVGIAEPEGRWARFVMKQKLGFILAMGGLQKNKTGFWVNLIKAQAASKGKGHGKGR